MGADQSTRSNVNVKVKNTFIEVSARQQNSRLRRTQSGPALRASSDIDDDLYSYKFSENAFTGLNSAVDSNRYREGDSNTQADKVRTAGMCRLKTFDEFGDQGSGVDTETTYAPSVPASIDSEKALYSPTMQQIPPQMWSQTVVFSTPMHPVYAFGQQQDIVPVAMPFLEAIPDAMPAAWGLELLDNDHLSADARSEESFNQNHVDQEQVSAPVRRKTGRWANVTDRKDAWSDVVDDEQKVSCPTSGKVPREQWTNRMLRNLPNDYTRQDLLDLLNSKNFEFEFLYLPIDWRKGANLGYAFVSLASPREAERLQTEFEGYADWKYPSVKKCEVAWGGIDQQTIAGNVERFRNSPVMHAEVADEYKPMLFKNGKREVFPGPTQYLKLPRGYRRSLVQAAARAN